MSQLPRYESYKDSGVQWLGEIPNHWNVKQLKFAVTCNDEALGENTELDYEILYVDISSVSLTEGIKHKEELLFENAPSRARRVVKSGDVLVSTVRTYLKAITYVESAEENLIASTGFAVLRPSEKFDSKFIGYWIQSEGMVGNIVANSVGVSYPAINSTDLVRLPIVELPLSEQKFIADFLDKRLAQVDALIAKQETLLEKLAEQRVALISHAVTKGLNPDVEMKESGVSTLGEVPLHWEIIKNKFIFDFSKGLTITKENLVDEGIPCVSYGEVHSKFGFEVDPNKHQLKCVPETYIESDENSLLKYGDFIFADTSEDVKGSGNFTYLNSDIPTFAGYHTIIAKMSKLNNPRFLAYILDTEEHRNQIRMLIKGVKVFSITQAILKNTFVWLPAIDEQNQIVDYLDQEVEKYQQIGQRYELTITRLKEYRSTLITQVVTGKIDVRNLKVN